MCISLLFSTEKKKGKMPDFSGFSKKIEIKGLMEPDLEEFQKDKKIHPFQIEEIKKIALEFKVEPVTEDEIVIMETTRGTLVLKLFPHLAPNHCNNFKKLARANNKTSTSNSFMNNLKSFANSRITKDNRPRYIMSRGY